MAHTAEKVVIIGSGPAGYTAAIYAARAALNPLVFAGTIPNMPGGQLVTTTDIENFPGFPKGIAGPELMDLMRGQAERFGARIVEENAISVDFSERPFHIKHDSGEVKADTVIIATGASAIWTNAKGEDAYKNRGVSACATCDGFFFKNLDVLVIGGGDTAMEEADYLTKHARKVTVVHRRDQLRASRIMQERVMKNPKISFLWNKTVEEILGDGKRLTSVVLHDTKDGSKHQVEAQGMFVAIGHKPNTEVFSGQLELDPKGYIRTEAGTTRTSVPGVFAAGDVQDPHYRQAITAAASGCQAAIDAERFLAQ